MTTPRYGHSAVLLADGRVLIAGGQDGSSQFVATVELYDASAGTFTQIPWNGGLPLFLLPDGRVFVWVHSNSAEIYEASTGTFTGAVPWNGRYPVMLLPDGRILTNDAQGNTLQLYDPSTDTFAAAGSLPWQGYFTSTITLLADGKVLLTRYEDDSAFGKVPIPYPLAALYDPSTGTFTETAGNMITNHAGPTATLLTNGKVLIAGGEPSDGEPGSPYAELYDPATQIFAATRDMAVGRLEHTATLLPDGSVLVAGGHICCIDPQASAELYDPVVGAFRSAGNMTTGRAGHTATLLKDGRVLITGGYQSFRGGIDAVLSSAEIYTPPNPLPAPALLSLSGDGKGQGAIQHADTYRLVSADNPATAGEAIVIYCTGLIDGNVIPPQVTIGGRVAEVLWFGNTPGYPGLNQINVRVPFGVASGPSVSVRISYMGRPSNEVTIGVQ